jgi:DNA-nicking Smr family endonuclease
MDFGKILDQWDKRGGPVYDKDADSSALSAGLPDRRSTSAFRRRKLRRKSPEATLDIHGLNQDEAWNALTVFFNDAKNSGLEKVLIIHGKGNHTGEGRPQPGVLKKMVRDFIERCPFAGESGYSNGREGG